MAKNSDNDLIDMSENIFSPEWYDNVTDAINFAMNILEANGKLKNREQIIQKIIDYNIEKTLNESTHIIPLPKIYDWSNSDVIEIFEDFAYLLNLIKVRSDFKKHVITIKFGKNKKGMDHFDFWRNMSLEEMRDIKLDVKNISKTTLKCTIQKIKDK